MRSQRTLPRRRRAWRPWSQPSLRSPTSARSTGSDVESNRGGVPVRTICFAIAIVFSVGAQAANELKIGFLSTLSGPAGTIGVEIRDGFNLALKLAGGKLGGLPTEVVFADDTLNPET